jgi:hypothetical protein
MRELGWYRTKLPMHSDHYVSVVCPHLSSSFVIYLPDLWQLPAETPSSETGETLREIAMNFAYEVSLFILVGFFNML